jgi:hypothetical protein
MLLLLLLAGDALICKLLYCMSAALNLKEWNPLRHQR